MTEDGFVAHADKGSPAPPDPIAYLSEHGYTHVHTYQPDSRYWTFQWIEARLAGAGLGSPARHSPSGWYAGARPNEPPPLAAVALCAQLDALT